MAGQSFVIDSVAWHTQGAAHVPSQQVKGRFRRLALFLQESGLASRQLLTAQSEVADDFKISSVDVTDEGLSFLKKHYDPWLRFLDRGGDLDARKHLEDALARMRGVQPPKPARRKQRDRVGSATPKADSGARPASREASSPVEVYDKARWHLEGEFPADLSEDYAYIPFGYVLGWLVERDLLAEDLRAAFAGELDAWRQHRLTGPQLYKLIGGALTSEDVRDEARPFLTAYLNPETGPYLVEDYATLYRGRPTPYHVPDERRLYEQVREMIDRRHLAWKRQQLG